MDCRNGHTLQIYPDRIELEVHRKSDVHYVMLNVKISVRTSYRLRAVCPLFRRLILLFLGMV